MSARPELPPPAGTTKVRAMVHQEFTLRRSVPATVIPAGEPVTLHQGTPVFVTQALGSAITVRTSAGLFRLRVEDADALGVTAAEVAAAGLAVPAAPTAAADEPFAETGLWEALRGTFDPEIPVNIVDLGLVYDVSVEERAEGGRRVDVQMTLTAPGCGMGRVIAEDARQRLLAVPGVAEAQVHLVWEPLWSPQRITPEGRRILGLE